MNEAIAKLIERIETNLKVTNAPGMDIRFTMDRDAAAAFVEQLRATDQLLTEYQRLRAVLTIVRNYIHGTMIAAAVVVPEGETPTGKHPSLLDVIDAALAHQGSKT